MENKFTKDMLETGMLVKNRDGTVFLVLKDKDVIIGHDEYDYLTDYSEDLKSKHGWSGLDIMEVYKIGYPFMTSLNVRHGILVWKRDDEKLKKIEELEQTIQKATKQLQELKGEL